jgi:hypothetical protein
MVNDRLSPFTPGQHSARPVMSCGSAVIVFEIVFEEKALFSTADFNLQPLTAEGRIYYPVTNPFCRFILLL